MKTSTRYFLILLCLACSVSAQDLTGKKVGIPDELTAQLFTDSDVTPSPACLAVSAEGEVFIGVDLNGSLGKGAGKGRIIRALDTDHDGKADQHTVFAEIDNPRGMIPVDNRLYVLHTVIPDATGILEAMHLSELIDKDRDGKADGSRILVKSISPPKHNQSRGADHTTNGIQMGIDGWIYIAVGDFGIHQAQGTDGTELTMLGGGIVRVRPDGTELEVYTHGLRNIYDVAIDPRMNIYTRGNTNDGGGWNIRFIHQIQSGEYGYPVLFKHFTDEILPALADLGGGSGTGALFFAEPGWPEKYSKVPMMCDWGRSQLVIHRLTPDGGSFTQAPEAFIKLSQISDADVDASGRLYLSAWDGAGFSGNPKKGYTVRVTPKDWTYHAFPDVRKLDANKLLKLLVSDSAKASHRAQQELLRRSDEASYATLLKLAGSPKISIEGRIAAIFTASQWKGADATKALVELTSDASIRAFALRALADRIPLNQTVPTQPFLEGLKDPDPQVQIAAAVGLGRMNRPDAAEALLIAASTLPPPSLPDAAPPSTSPAFLSKKISGSKSVNIKASTKGMKQLVLAVLDGGDGDGNDHGAWLDPTLIRADGSQVALTDRTWTSAEQGWGSTEIGKDCRKKELIPVAGDKKAKPFTTGIGTHANSFITYDLSDESFIQFQARGVMTDGSKGGGSIVFAVAEQKDQISTQKKNDEGPHATPNSAIVVPHIAIQALRRIDATPALVRALGGPNAYTALWALKYRYEVEVVDGLTAAHNASSDPLFRYKAMETLLRITMKEKPYDGTWWWSTRPDTHGPFYYTEPWAGTERAHAYITKVWNHAGTPERVLVAKEMLRHRVEIPGIDTAVATTGAGAKEEQKVDLSKIDTSVGEVGKMAIEDVIVALNTVKGDSKLGEQLFTRQGCVACHTLRSDETLKGPYMGHVGNILNRDQIAESILKPNASISQGFATVSINTTDGQAVAGFISAESATEIEVRDIAGKVYTIKASTIKSRHELPISMMPPGLANALSMKEFASLVKFLSERKQ
ncbi:MAG: putative heme-binding domain-containing protein [Kiritimatiellia bacterium]|jgi:putative heme-binding domain-containing protein